MKWIGLTAGTVLVVSVAWLASGAFSADKPERADCIAGAELQWPDKSQDKVKILNKIAETEPANQAYPTAGLAIRDRERIYTIFHRDCERRRFMMKKIMAEYERDIAGFPPYRIIEQRIEPSPSTIQVYGEHWSDGQEPEGIFSKQTNAD